MEKTTKSIIAKLSQGITEAKRNIIELKLEMKMPNANRPLLEERIKIHMGTIKTNSAALEIINRKD